MSGVFNMSNIDQVNNTDSLKHSWLYKNVDGIQIGYVARFEDVFGNKKVFPFFKRNANSYSAGFEEGKRCLFGADMLAKHPHNQPVYIVEGEKCASALQSLGLCAVTSPGGAQSAKNADWSGLNNHHDVVILPDNDSAGEIYARDVYRILRKIGISAKVVRLPDLKSSEDVVDWIIGWQGDWDGYTNIKDPTGSLKEEFLTACQNLGEIPSDWNIADLADLASAPEGWGIPTPVAPKIPDVAQMTKELVPELLKDFVFDTSHSMQAPADFIVVPLLISIGSIIGTACVLRPKQYDNWEVVPNLWGACIGSPAMMKTPTIKEALKFIDGLQFEYGKQFDKERNSFKVNELARKGLLDDIQKQLAEVTKGKGKDKVVDSDAILKLKNDYSDAMENNPEPVRRIFRVNEGTVQSLTQLMTTNKRGILMFRDEMVGLMSTWESKPDERAFYLEGWNGNGAYTDHKISRGLTDAANICISLVGGIQPDKLAGYLNQTLKGGNDGLMQRFQLAVWPDAPLHWSFVDIEKDRESEKRIRGIFKTLAEMDFTQFGAKQDEFEGNPFLRFDVKAQKIFKGWLENLQNIKLKQEESPVMIEHLTKYRSLMPSLALIFHCIELADGQKQDAISEKNARLAIAWCDYLETHARRIYAMSVRSEHDAAISLSNKIREGQLPKKFTPKKVYDKNWHLLSNRQEVESACEILIENNWLKMDTDKPSNSGVGRPRSPEYIINPVLLNS